MRDKAKIKKTCAYCGYVRSMFKHAILCYPCRRVAEKTRMAISSKASRLVFKAVARGDLPRLDGTITCVDCGKPAKVYEHRDYDRPLDVSPVCISCNVKRGPAKQIIDLGLGFREARKKRPDPHTAPAIG